MSGRSEDILEAFYSARFASAPPGLRELVEDRLLSADGYRESLALDTALGALQKYGVETRTAEEAIARLVDERLLVAEEQSGVRRIELTHDILTGVARRSRDKRREREALAKAEKERSEVENKAAEQRRLVRRARIVAVAFIVLFAVSLAALIWALSLREKARLAAAMANQNEQKAKSEAIRADVAAAKAKEEAARADSEKQAAQTEETKAKEALAAEAELSTKLRQQLHQASWASFNEAELLFGLGEWRKGIAHLGRAITFDPENPVPAERLFEELIVNRHKAQPPILANLRHNGQVYSAVFSPGGSRILTASSDSTAKLWDIGTPRDIARDIQQFSIRKSDAESRFATASSPIRQAEAISEIASGLQVSQEGSLVPLEDERRSQLAGDLTASAKGVSAQARFLRWFLRQRRRTTYLSRCRDNGDGVGRQQPSYASDGGISRRCRGSLTESRPSLHRSSQG